MVLVDEYTRSITDNLSAGEDAVNGDAGLRGPGHCGSESKRERTPRPSIHHLTSRAHLQEQQ